MNKFYKLLLLPDKFIYYVCNKISFFFLNNNILFSPNYITLTQIPLLYYLYFKSKYYPKISAILLLMSVFLDCLDGEYARVSNQMSNFGAKLDFYTDCVTFFVILHIFLYKYVSDLKLVFIVLISQFQVDPTTHKPKTFIAKFNLECSCLIRILITLIWLKVNNMVKISS